MLSIGAADASRPAGSVGRAACATSASDRHAESLGLMVLLLERRGFVFKESTKETAMQYCGDPATMGIFTPSNREGLLPAMVYAACRKNGKPICSAEIAKETGVRKTRMNSLYRRIVSMLDIEMEPMTPLCL